MKKLLTIAAVFLTAALVFTGCSNPASGGGEGPTEKTYPGTWTTDANTWSSYNTSTGRTATVNNRTVTVSTNTDTFANMPAAGNWSYGAWDFTRNGNFKGFSATASSTSTAGCGFCFGYSEDSSKKVSAYVLIIQNGACLVTKQIAGVWDTPAASDWVSNTCINTGTSTNEVVVYTDSDSSIVIEINGTEVRRITSPESTLCIGDIGFSPIVSASDTGTVTQTYTFKKFQK